MINGKNAQNKQVQDLFCTVQLNINNPNFLIMQGRITKVLNMKPPEILSMIEEAAGTSTYETKKEKSLSLIQKKDSKLDDLNDLINEGIKPKLEKLRKDQATYLEYQKICRDVDYLTRISISYKYLQCVKNVENCENTIAKLNLEIENSNKQIELNVEEVAQIEADIAGIQENLNSVSYTFNLKLNPKIPNFILFIYLKNSGDELKELEKKLDQLNQEDAKNKAQINSMQGELVSEQRKLKTQQKSNEVDVAALKKKEEAMSKTGGMFESLKQQEADDLKNYQMAQKKVEAVNLGLALNDEGEASSLQDQLTVAKSRIAEATSTIKQSEMELKYSKQALATKEKNVKSSDESYDKDKRVIETTQKEIKNVENQLKSINYEDGQIESLMTERDNMMREMRQFRHELDRYDKFEFRYDQPDRNWDSSRVKGMAAGLFKIKDQKYTRALSSVIGGNWRSVVTDNDETGKALLERGNLQSRTTIIPMSKVQGRLIDQNTVKIAQNLVGKENVVPAIDLIEYDRQYEPAMKHIFGGTFICANLEVGKKVTYHNNIRTRSFTLDGDYLDPAGSLSGGAVDRGMPILEEAAKYNQMKEVNDRKNHELQQIIRKIENLKNVAEKYKSIKDKLDNLQVQLSAAQDRMKSTTFQQEQDEINELRAKIVKLEETIKECKETKTSNEAKAKDLQVKVANFEGNREREIKSAENELKVAKQKYEKSQNEWKKREKEYETLKMEIESLKATIEEGNLLVLEMQKNIEEMQKKVAETSISDEAFKKQVKDIKDQIKAQKDAIAAQNKEIKTKNARKEKLMKNNNDFEVEIKKKENEIKKVKNDNADGYNKIQHLENKYTWIPEDKAHFGAKNTRYDYSKEDPVKAGQKLQTMMESKEKLSRNINQEAMMLLEKEEEHYNKIMKREGKIKNDRQKLLDGIKHMDAEKVKNLQKAWEKVNSNFGSIFSTLLPGAQAKLVPPEGKTFLAGLEVKVGFNNKWKDTLTELSGGQRSLVALSLILAMLKYKPAPLYILDEVDAALDLSHTQNIGAMLKSHFKNSQFIIVSLKDGMFNNANVLFRTKFVDGVSGVMRTVNKN